MSLLFHPRQAGYISERSGCRDVDALARRVLECGFDPAEYTAAQGDPGPNAALAHFLSEGHASDHDLLFHPMPVGVAAFADLDIPNRGYANSLFRAMFFGQLTHEATSPYLWSGVGRDLIQRIRDHGGLPFMIIGDSHLDHYVRRAWAYGGWFAPLPLPCPGATAAGLAIQKDGFGAGVKIMEWAARSGALADVPLLPVLLKFGGIDTDVAWVRRRITAGQTRFSWDQFHDHAQETVARYSRFLDQLSGLVHPESPRVCSVCPTGLTDEKWIKAFIRLHTNASPFDVQVVTQIHRYEVPGMRVRNQLRAHFNDLLRGMCDSRGIAFVDDFSPFVDADCMTEERFLPPGDRLDHHLDFRRSEAGFVNNLRIHAGALKARLMA